MDQNTTITKTDTALMIATAAIVDLLQLFMTALHLIPFVGSALEIIISPFVTLFAFLTFYVWFKIKGITFERPSQALRFGGGTLIEFMPIIDALPAWTLTVWLTTRGERREINVQSADSDTSTKRARNRPPLPRRPDREPVDYEDADGEGRITRSLPPVGAEIRA